MNKYSTINRRSAFTLVELLLVIAIISILASLGVGVLAQAQDDAAAAASRSRINIIQKILEVELEDYEVRRSPVGVENIITMIAGSSLTDASSGERLLLHVKNLRRMIVADLIRAELPDGSRSTSSNSPIGSFPSGTLQSYLNGVGIDNTEIASAFFPTGSTFPYGVSRWSDWAGRDLPLSDWSLSIPDIGLRDGIDTEAADKSELLYQMLVWIDIDGEAAVDQLGSRAIGDTDNDGYLEIVDGWGEPLYLQWQQEWLTLAGSPNDNIWNEGNGMAGLSREHANDEVPFNTNYSKPVLPSQIRPVLISERMLKIDGISPDYLSGPDPADNHTF